MVDDALIRRLPKAELHCHLDGSLRPETLLELAQAAGQPLPAGDVPGLLRAMRVPDNCSLETYLSCFAITLGVLQSADALERAAFELAEDMAAEGAWYLEVRFAPILSTQGGLSPDDAIVAVRAGLARAEGAHGIATGIIVCALRHLSPEASLAAARLAVAHRADGVVGFDLAGPEAGHPPQTHASAFLFAREHDLACTCHAGEGDGADSVRAAIHRCGADRIGHGTRLLLDPALTAYAVDRRIPIEICLTSNVQTSATPDYASHPLRAYFDRGLPVVLCTDNRLMSGTTLVAEYAHAARALHFSFEELAAIARTGLASAFQPWAERQAWLRRFDAALAAIRSAAPIPPVTARA